MGLATIDLAGTPPFLAQSAASWLDRFYPGIKLAFGKQSITLLSDAHDTVQLERMWRAALLNEKMLEASSDRRRSTLETLFQ